jgi:hypothetical protein
MPAVMTTVCAWCGRVKKDGQWECAQDIFTILRTRKPTTLVVGAVTEDLSHGCCPDCIREYHPSVADKILGPRQIA